MRVTPSQATLSVRAELARLTGGGTAEGADRAMAAAQQRWTEAARAYPRLARQLAYFAHQLEPGQDGAGYVTTWCTRWAAGGRAPPADLALDALWALTAGDRLIATSASAEGSA